MSRQSIGTDVILGQFISEQVRQAARFGRRADMAAPAAGEPLAPAAQLDAPPAHVTLETQPRWTTPSRPRRRSAAGHSRPGLCFS